MKYLAKGKRGIVHTTLFEGKQIVVKQASPHTTAIARIQNEASWLPLLNAKGIGPQYISSDDECVRMEYIQGPLLKDAKPTQKIYAHLMEQARTLDQLGVNKGEMHRITKNCIIRNGIPVLIDFERCKNTLHPKNVTQYCQFLQHRYKKIPKKILKNALQAYKKTYNQRAYARLKRLFFPS